MLALVVGGTTAFATLHKTVTLDVDGTVTTPLSLSFADLAKREQIDLTDVLMQKSLGEDETASWSGVSLEEILAEAGANRPLFYDCERCRQGARAQQNGKIVRALRCKITRNLAGAAKDRLADLRSRNHVIVEDDGEQLADILLRITDLPDMGVLKAHVEETAAKVSKHFRALVGRSRS